jgi:hypothetical protein
VLSGIAVSEAIFLCAKKLPPRQTLLIFSPRDSSVSLGRFQAVEANFTPLLKAEKLSPIRRPRGGGLLLHTPPQVVFCSTIWGDEEVARMSVLNGVLMVLEQFGLDGQLDGLTGITVRGRRISEYILTSADEITQLFGVLLLNTNYELMGRLTGTRPELLPIEVRRIIGLVTSIYHETARVPQSKYVRAALKNAVPLSNALRASRGRLAHTERRALAKIVKGLRSRNWLLEPIIAHPSLFDGSFQPRRAEFKCEAGQLNVALISSAEENVIRDISLSGSFMFYPEERLGTLESNLVGCELSEAALIERISTCYLQEGLRSPGISPMDIAYTILRASVEF